MSLIGKVTIYFKYTAWLILFYIILVPDFLYAKSIQSKNEESVNISSIYYNKSSENLFSLNIDFSQSSGNVQNDFKGYFAEHENSSSFTPQSYTVDGVLVTIDAEWPAGTENTAKQMIDRGNNSLEYSDLLRDWIGTDGRVAKVPMKLTLEGLPQGYYQWKSYHHDNNDQTGVFKVKVTDASGISEYKGNDISNGNLPFENITGFETLLNSDGSEIILQFEMESYPDNSTSFFVMNGFSINKLDTTLLPTPIHLLSPLTGLKYVSVNPRLQWTKSNHADEYNLYLGTTDSPEFYEKTDNTEVQLDGLKEKTKYFWKVEAINNNGMVESETGSFSTGSKDNVFSDKMMVNFSHERSFYNEPFTLTLTSNNSETDIIYTLDCSVPSAGNGKVFNGSVSVDSSTVIKAIAISGDSSSAVYTNSYLFTSTIKKQSKNPAGFPEYWGGSKVILADYEMDPDVINNPEYESYIDEAFLSVPSLSLSMNVEDWFDHNYGLYVGYPNSDISREKAVTAEFIFNTDEENFAVECGVQNQGGTSIVNWKIPKQSMRLLFKKIYGPGTLKYKLFPDSEIESINTLVVDGLLYSWLHPWDDKQRKTSLYFRDQLASDMQNNMGGLSFHGRYVNLFINGLYWGIYDLHERPDDAFMAEYLEAEREDFDIIKHNPKTVVAGSNAFYLEMLDVAREGLAATPQFKKIQKYLDLPAFIDYMILNFYLGNYDWAHQNYYAARNKTGQTGFRFYTWDAEHVMRYSKVDYNNLQKNDKGGPTELHTLLEQNLEYRVMFADAVYRHLFNQGALTPENFERSFNYRKNEIEKAIILESARWGDYRIDSTGVTYTKNDYWIPEVNKVINDYIPRRRDIFIAQLKAENPRLFPSNMPPDIEIEEVGSLQKIVKLVNPNLVEGEIYYTLDGSDPRKEGGAIQGIKYSQPISIVNTSMIKARFVARNSSEWTALAEKPVIMNDVYGETIVISEIMYHPNENNPEFIELLNTGNDPVSLDGFRFTDGIEFTFLSGYLFPQKGIVLTNDTALFREVYGFNAFGQYEKKLSNAGESVILENRFSQLVDSVAYLDTIPWPVIADGDGFSIELISLQSDNSLAANWKASDKQNGTPFEPVENQELKAKIYPNPFKDVVVIEMEYQDSPFETYKVEIYNQFGSKVADLAVQSHYSKMRLNLSHLFSGLYIIRIIPPANSALPSTNVKAIKF